MDSPELLVEPETQTEVPAALAAEFASVYEEHSRAIFYLCLRFLSDETQAQDATHDVFLKAFRKLGSFRQEANLRTWLYRIAINHCQNVQGSWARRNIHATDDDALLDNASPHSESPLHVLETKELGERIQRTLDALPEEYRLILLLVADEQLSYDEVGELTGQSADAIRGKLHRARKAFALHFAKTA